MHASPKDEPINQGESITKGLLESGAALLTGRNRREVFQRILKGVERLGFRRVRLYLISTDRGTLTCVAQAGMETDFEGYEWSAAGDRTTHVLFTEPWPHIFEAATENPDQHAIRLGRTDDDQWVEAPLVVESKVVGKISADNEHHPLPASLDLDLLDLFAQQAAAVLENSRLLEEARHRLAMFEQLREVAKTLASAFDPKALLGSIVKSAVALLNAKNGGIYEYSHETRILTVVAELNRKDLIGRTMPEGMGMAGRLVEGEMPYLIEDNYGTWPDHDPSCDFFGAVLEAPLRLRGKIAGVIYVDDEIGRKFTKEDAELLTMFTGHAAAALESAELAREREARLARLQRLVEAIAETTAPEKPFPERLDVMAERVADILQADECRIHMAKPEAELPVIAKFQKRPAQAAGGGGLNGGGDWNIQTQALANHVARTGKPLRAHGKELADIRTTLTALPSGGTEEMTTCCSVMGLPLFKRDAGRETFAGVVLVLNKQGADGKARPHVGFSEPELELLRLFAQAIVSAIVSAELLLYEQALVQCSLDGIIATDRFGKVTEFNAQAEDILGWSKEEVVHADVQQLYAEGEAQRIGKLLRESATGAIGNEEATVAAKDGTPVPIRLSANNLWDATGEWVGSVGHFVDLRKEREAERRRQLLTEAITTVAREGDLRAALRYLVSRLVTNPTYSFGHALLLLPDHETLDIVAAYPDETEPLGSVNWRSWIGESTCLSRWPGLADTLRAGKPKLFQEDREEDRPMLRRLAKIFGLAAPMRSWLVVPMVTHEIIGYIGLGEFECEHPSIFDEDYVQVIETVSTQVSVLIGRMRLDKLAKERLKDIEDLNQASLSLAGRTDLKELESEILNQARTHAEADFASMVILDESYRGELFKREFIEVGYTPEARQQFERGDLRKRGCTARVIRERYLECRNLSSRNSSNLMKAAAQALRKLGVNSFQGVLLEVDQRPVAVLYISHKAKYNDSTPFPRTQRFIQSFASTAAMALKAALLTDQMQRAKNTLDALAKISTLGDLDKTMAAVADATRELLSCDVACLHACEAQGFEVRRSKTSGHTASHPPTRLTPDSPVYRILQYDKEYVADDVPKDRLLTNGSFAALERVKSCVAIPLQIAGRKVGALFANYRTPFRPTKEDLATLGHIADQAAIAIHTAQLFEKKENQRQALDDLAKTLLSAATRSAALGGACKVIGQHLRVRATGAVLPDRDGLLRAEAAWGWQHRPELTFQPGQLSFSGWIIERRQPVVVDDLSQPQDFVVLPHLREMEVKTMMGVPMFRAGQDAPIGAMLVFSSLDRHFTADEKELLDLLSKETAIALERFAGTERAESLRAAAREVAKVMVLGDRDLKETLDAVVNGIGATSGCDAVTLYACDPQTGRIDRAPSMYGVRYPQEVSVAANILAADSLVYKALHTSQPEAIEDITRDRDFAGKRFVERESIRSCLVVPLAVAHKTVGVIFVNYRRPHRFEEEEIGDITLFANQAAVAIRNTRLFNDREKMRGVVAGQMALAWLGMIDSASRHRTQNFAVTIRNEAEDLAALLGPKSKKKLTARERNIAESLEIIQERAKEIIAQRLATPRLGGQEAESVNLFHEVEEWAEQRRNQESGKGVLGGPEAGAGGNLRVRISPVWLSRTLEILVDNAMRAVERQPKPAVTLSIRRQAQVAVLGVADNGHGIPAELLGRLFREAVPKTPESRGSGVGLLIVQTIAQTYQGDIRVASTGPAGTTIELSLPIDDSMEGAEAGGGK